MARQSFTSVPAAFVMVTAVTLALRAGRITWRQWRRSEMHRRRAFGAVSDRRRSSPRQWSPTLLSPALSSSGPSWIQRAIPWVRRTQLAQAVARATHMRTYDIDLARALEMAARQLRSGAAVHTAIAAAARHGDGAAGRDLRQLGARARVDGLSVALASWVGHRRTRTVELAAAVLGLGFRTGGASARALDDLAAGIRQRAAAQAEARSLTAQARLSAWVLGVAPLGFAATVAAIDPGVGSFLITTPAGAALVSCGVALDVAGWWWMRRMVAAVAW